MPGVRHSAGAGLRLRPLPGMRVGAVRMKLPALERRARGTDFLESPTRSLLNPPESTGMPFWSLNPYVGCEFGCSYCYARYAHRYALDRAGDDEGIPAATAARIRALPQPWEAFERVILVKRREDAAAALDRDLRRVQVRARTAPQTLAIGTATDPYQPAERRYRLTRLVLERLTRERALAIEIVTKSPLVQRDVSLLLALQQRHHVAIHISLISVDPTLVRRFERRSPLPRVRLRALERLCAAGVNAGLICAPVLPGITDTATSLRALFRAAQGCGARHVHGHPLRVYAAVREPLLPVVDRYCAPLAARYRAVYRRGARVPPPYRRALSRRLCRLAAEVGVPIYQPPADSGTRADLQLQFWGART